VPLVLYHDVAITISGVGTLRNRAVQV